MNKKKICHILLTFILFSGSFVNIEKALALTISSNPNSNLSTVDSNEKGKQSNDTTTSFSTTESSNNKIQNSNTDNLQLTDVPQYVIFDPQKESYIDEKGSTDFSLNGIWSSSIPGENEFNLQIGAAQNPINNWYWWGAKNLKNNEPVNNLHYNLSSVLDLAATTNQGTFASEIKKMNDIPISHKNAVVFGMRSADGNAWKKYITIPLYIKAPKVTVDDSPSNLQKMLSNQTITGRG
ncbi:hypothetical protein PFZ79_002819, partial [Enterococcus hirae]|nr:hypothetical protein [Enterococcus hirae]